MGASIDETMREVEEESGCMRGGARFQQVKRERIRVEICNHNCFCVTYTSIDALTSIYCDGVVQETLR